MKLFPLVSRPFQDMREFVRFPDMTPFFFKFCAQLSMTRSSIAVLSRRFIDELANPIFLPLYPAIRIPVRTDFTDFDKRQRSRLPETRSLPLKL